MNMSDIGAIANLPTVRLQHGSQIDPYTLLELIGYGGEAVVWSGWDNRHERVVAIKMIAQAQEDQDLNTRVSSSFEQQVHLLASLDHPHILPLYEFGGTDEHFYFVMHYGCAGSLANLLAKGPLSLDLIINLCAQITSALAYLHERGIVHRDIKPSNILLDSQNRVYLADFGLAKSLIQETVPLHTGRGTGPYVPYEQFALSTITPQADIFSLGVLIYEMLVGKLPWDGIDSLFLRQQTRNDELPDLQGEGLDLPPKLTDNLRKMTAFQWRERPSSAGEALDLLLDVFPGEMAEEARVIFEAAPKVDYEDLLIQDGESLLNSSLHIWQLGDRVFPTRLTHFALIDAAMRKNSDFRQSLDGAQRQFMLRGALTYGYQLEYWWQQAEETLARSQVCIDTLLNEEDEAAVERAMSHLLDEAVAGEELDEVPAPVLERLVDIAVSGQGWSLRQDALHALARLAPHRNRWQEIGLSESSDQKLATLALGEDSQARQAARLIGKIRSETAVQAILMTQSGTKAEVFYGALEQIHVAAGGLPNLAPARVRFRVRMLHWRQGVFEAQESAAVVRVLVGLLAGLVISLLLVAGLFFIQDAQMRDVLLQPYPVSNIVTIVAVDDASLERFGRWADWDRSLHAELIDSLHAAGSRAIVFDFVFASQTDQDALLSESMAQAGQVVFPAIGVGDAYLDQPGTVRFLDRVLPQAVFVENSAAVGHTNILIDPDGVVRRLPTIIEARGERYPSLALAGLQVYLGTKDGELAPDRGSLAFAGRQIPLAENSAMVLNFAGPPADPFAATYNTVSYQDVIDGKVPAELFKDKLVLVGMTASAEPDRYQTPVSQGRPMYGIEILANAIESIWQERFIRYPSQFVSVLSLLILGALTGFVNRRPWTGLLFSLGMAVLYFLLVTWLFDAFGLALGLFFPFLTIALSFVLVTTYNYAVETRQRRKIMQMFDRRVSPETALATVKAVQKGTVNLEGQVRDVSVLICELRGYTAYAKLYDPQAVIEMANRYWEIVNQASLESEGTSAYREGEQALVFFNAPLPQPDHALRAIKTAFAIREQVAAYQQALPGDHPHNMVNLSYGIYTGKAIVGYVDHAQRQEYTVMGNAVSIAAQLTHLARPGQILINGGAYEKSAQKIYAEFSTSISVRDQATGPLAVYEARYSL